MMTREIFSSFAEKTYLLLRESAKSHQDIDFIAVSHSDQASTDKWVRSIPQFGSESENLRVVVDDTKVGTNGGRVWCWLESACVLTLDSNLPTYLVGSVCCIWAWHLLVAPCALSCEHDECFQLGQT